MTIALPRLDRSTRAERGLTLADFLVPIRVGERMGTRVRHIALIVAGALVIFLSAQIYIAREPVPLTGQTFGVLVVGGALGFRRGFAAVALYVLLGVVGLPFFAEGKGGIDIIWGATGGYLIGFVVAGAVVGRLAELGWDRRLGGSLAAMLIGSVIIYAIGLPWLKLSVGYSWAEAIADGLAPFVLWDAAKLVVAGALFPAAWWLLDRRPDDR
jgi:biotin transport system substrate-specific component